MINSETPYYRAINRSNPLSQELPKQRFEFNKLKKRLRRNVGKAIEDFNMIEENDLIMVCVSGGKDSYTMLEIILNLQSSAPIKFDLVAVNLDQKQPNYPEKISQTILRKKVFLIMCLKKILIVL